MKRQSPAGFHFVRQGGACPLWNVHEALTRPDQILIQRVCTPTVDSGYAWRER